jgi:hypothetical protein
MSATRNTLQSRNPSVLKNMALFLVAPFVGLAYALLLPFVGVAMLAWVAGKAMYGSPKVRAAMRFGGYAAEAVAAPLAGLAFILMFPFVGLAALTWLAVRAAMDAVVVAPAPAMAG